MAGCAGGLGMSRLRRSAYESREDLAAEPRDYLAAEPRDYLAARAGFTVYLAAAPARREIQDPFLRECLTSRERE
jgi:hypothetical protein